MSLLRWGFGLLISLVFIASDRLVCPPAVASGMMRTVDRYLVNSWPFFSGGRGFFFLRKGSIAALWSRSKIVWISFLNM